ncbi:MAG: AAA family ATPase, partial [Candidatus Hodarchaeota archaeon]
MTEISLLVAEAVKGDVGRSLVRIDIRQMQELHLETGDVVEIEGNKKTGALVIPGRSQDRSTNIIRMDGLLRRNAQTSIGEKVKVRKASPKPADHIIVAPVEEGISLRAPGKVVRQALRGKPVTKDDLVNISGPIRREPMASPSGQGIDEFFSRFFGAAPIALGEIGLVVVSTKPNGIVIIGDQTSVEVMTEAPKHLQQVSRVTYEDIGGLDQEIQRVREMIELPMKHPELFQRLGIDPPKGVLLHGSPGTGKTLLAKAVANESGVNFVSLAGPEIMSKFYGESEQRVRQIFEDAEKNAPSIIFIDEIDSIAPKREDVTGEVERRVVAQLLALMDGLKGRGKVIVIGATNRPNALDPALRRPGRFDREIEIGVPDKSARLEILMVHTRGMPLEEKVDLLGLSERTHGFVGADVAALTREAAMHTLRRILPEIKFEEETLPPEILQKLVVTKEDFEEALKSIDPSAMREVLIELPNVRWEDVGGLSE